MAQATSGHPSDFFGDARDELLKRADKGSVTANANEVVHSSTGATRKYLSLKFPNGRDERPIVIGKRDAEVLRLSNFEDWVFIGDYNAILDREKSCIEAVISSNGRPNSLFTRRLIALPGVEPLDPIGSPADVDGDVPRDETSEADNYRLVTLSDGNRSISLDDPWRLRLGEAGGVQPVVAEISRFTRGFDSLFAQFDVPVNRISLKLEKPGLQRHDDALDFLESYFSSLSFELDLRFDLMLSLDRKRDRTILPRRNISPNKSPIVPPRRKYSREAVSLYSYGRASSGRPLFQYLAYYQAVEYFFPSFHGEEVLRRLRNELRDPRFDAEDDAKLHRIISITTNGGKAYATEKEQLLATLSGSVTDGDLREFITGAHGMVEFLAKTNAIKGIPEVSIGVKSKVVEMVSERVYKLRCRIVHTKSDGGGNLPDVLLPYGAEAEKMHYDLMLIQYLCQKVIIAGSRGSLW